MERRELLGWAVRDGNDDIYLCRPWYRQKTACSGKRRRRGKGGNPGGELRDCGGLYVLKNKTNDLLRKNICLCLASSSKRELCVCHSSYYFVVPTPCAWTALQILLSCLFFMVGPPDPFIVVKPPTSTFSVCAKWFCNDWQPSPTLLGRPRRKMTNGGDICGRGSKTVVALSWSCDQG